LRNRSDLDRMSPARSHNLVLTGALLLVLAAFGCDWLPRNVALNDPRIKPLLTAAAAFPRTDYGFTPLPVEARVRWESSPKAGYDAMLHITSRTYRTIAFRRDAAGYRWIGEQETFMGPHKYETVDGTFNEEIVLTYDVEHISGVPLNRLDIAYHGDDSHLSWPHVLTLAEARSVLKRWGY
jgi:hypothetical protein